MLLMLGWDVGLCFPTCDSSASHSVFGLKVARRPGQMGESMDVRSARDGS